MNKVFHLSFFQSSCQSQTSRSWYSHSSQWNTYRARLCWYNQFTSLNWCTNRHCNQLQCPSQPIPIQRYGRRLTNQSFDSKNHITQIWDTIWSRYQLTCYSSSNFVSLSVKTWQLWSFVSIIKRISTIIQQNMSIGNTHVSFIHCVLSIYEWLPNVCILWITLDNNSQRMYKMASLVGQWRIKNSVHR